MDIIEFFDLSAGKWFSQRTIHHLTSGKLIAGKSNLAIEILPPEDSTVIQLCQQYQSDPSVAWGGLKFSWDGTVDGNPKKQTGSTTFVAVPNPDNQNQGVLLQQNQANLTSQTLKGRYHLDQEEVLTLVTESDDFYAEERLWYLIPNLRLRTRVLKWKDGREQAAFCSEIRMLQSS